ncbi:MAG: homocysteine S-methyltransferase family protein [Dehalococcoidia bacterium]
MGAIDSLQSRLEAGEVIIMDGGTGTEIQRRGVPVSPNTWSGEPMLTHPDTVRVIHEDYIRAGAEIIITNTFSTGRYMLNEAGLGDRTVELNKLGVRLAREARDNAAAGRPVIIAGSMSTYSPWLDPTVIPSYEAALADYREQSQALAEAGVDLIVIEMLIRTLDARAAVKAAVETGLPVWVGYSLQRGGETLYLGIHGKHGGETIPEAVNAVASMGVSAMFIMHSLSEDTGPGIEELSQHTSFPIGAYAHSIDFSTPEPRCDSVVSKALSPYEYLTYAREWVNVGAQVIGGCCGTTPEHIRVLKDNLPAKIPK